MKCFWIVLLVAHLMSLTTASAEEILVKLQTVVDGQTLNGKPIELECSEILASTDEPFRVKLIYGDTTLTLKGQLKSLAAAEYSLNCKEVRVVEREGEQQMRETTTVDLTFVAGGKEPVVEMNSVSSTATLRLDIPQMLGMSWSGGMTKENQRYASQDEFVITISRSEVEKK